ncbi:hypothetical protein [Pseudomonas proteolytica]|uniref:hypothetical protein n=1 Tax=Pseudomonas proteolytica TaxID=219574 RepID=UPI0030D8423B
MAQNTVEADESTQSQGVIILPSVTRSGQEHRRYDSGDRTLHRLLRFPLTLLETPQSFQGRLASSTGISSYQSGSQRTRNYSRSFLIETIQYGDTLTVIEDITNGSHISDLETAFYGVAAFTPNDGNGQDRCSGPTHYRSDVHASKAHLDIGEAYVGWRR